MLLKTKLYAPQPPANFVPRGRLMLQLDKGRQARLTLVRAPAGFGKTMLVANWITQRKLQAGWLSLDSADSDPTRFTHHLLTAIHQFAPECCLAFDVTDLTSTLNLNEVLPLLINNLTDLKEDRFLILDDYHLIDNDEIQAGMAMLLEHTPPKLHIIITSRNVLPFVVLPRLRLRQQVVDVDLTDLRFTSDEVAQFLVGTGLTLSAEQIAQIDARTEGWIGGLQLAAISMQGRDDVAGFIDALSGRQQYILDYLSAEAFGQTSAEIQQFLLETSILERFTASLCNAVTGRTDSQHIINQLRHQNLFIVALDERGEWHRYHHLFDEFLNVQLERTNPTAPRELNHRAAQWFLQQADSSTAIDHLLVAHDFTAAAEQIDNLLIELFIAGEVLQISRWLRALPADVIDASPTLLLSYAYIQVRQRDWRAAQAHVAKFKNRIAQPPPFTQAIIYLIESKIAVVRDDLPAAIASAVQSLNLLRPSSLQTHVTRHLLGLYTLTGDLVAMRRTYDAFPPPLAKTLYAELRAFVEQAERAIGMGLLHDGARLYRRGIQQAHLANLQGLTIVGEMHVGMGGVLVAWGEWESAEIQLQRGLALLQDTTLSKQLITARQSLSFVMQKRGNNAAAAKQRAKMGELVHAYDIAQLNALFAATEAEFAVERGELKVAARWLRNSRLPIENERVHLQTTEYRVLARVLLAHERVDEALTVLRAIEAAARAAEQRLLLVDALVLRAVGLARKGNQKAAVAVLREAIESAEPEGYSRPFHDYPQEISTLLYHVRQTKLAGFLPDYVDELQAAFTAEESLRAASLRKSAAISLPDPLTNRELEVLDYLVQGYTNQAIADTMFIAMSTTRTHLRSIYNKLNTHSRTHAIVRARELNLVSE